MLIASYSQEVKHVLYSRKYWQELNLVVGSPIANSIWWSIARVDKRGRVLNYRTYSKCLTALHVDASLAKSILIYWCMLYKTRAGS